MILFAAIFLSASTGFIFGWAMGSRMAKANQDGVFYEYRGGDLSADWAEAPGDRISPWRERRPF